MSDRTALLAPRLVTERGDVLTLPLERYVGEPTAAEIDAIASLKGPVLDVGCGPGRHVLALSARGISALGVDPSAEAVRLARSRGATVVQRSVFDRLPGEGRWVSALLLDGNIGIGGDPGALLLRIACLLRPRGTLLVELSCPDTATETRSMRIENGGQVSRWFPWSVLSVTDLAPLCKSVGFSIEAITSCEGRWFARLRAPGARPLP